MNTRRALHLIAFLLLVLTLGACGGDSGGETAADDETEATPECQPVGDPADADIAIDVTLQEWSVQPAQEEVPAGTIAFKAVNDGEEAHELVIVKADSIDDLPTTEDGAFDEEAYGEDMIVGEIEEFPSGETCTGVFDMEPGSYVLLCNLVEEEGGEVEAHYRLGMRTTFTVTG